jgi:hypothetical protein
MSHGIIPFWIASMSNKFLELLQIARQEKWHVASWCSTCGALDFRRAVGKIPDLLGELAALDFEALSDRDVWDAVVATAEIDSSLDWDGILQKWLEYAERNVYFADRVLFRLVTQVRCTACTRDRWVAKCITLALRTKNISLIESLVWRLGQGTSAHPELETLAVSMSHGEPRLRKALEETGLLPSTEPQPDQKKQDRYGMNLFGAIRRNDIMAIEALVAKGATLSVRNNEGQTPKEYAVAQGKDQYVALLTRVVE